MNSLFFCKFLVSFIYKVGWLFMRILHLLNWKLDDVYNVLDIVREQGFQAIQINPLQPLKEEGFDNWWLSYQPCGFRIGNQYGSKDDLKKLTIAAHERGIAIYADVICTHVAGVNDGRLVPHEKVDRILVDNPYFYREQKYISNWESRYEIVNYCAGLPSFDLGNWDLQNIIIAEANEVSVLDIVSVKKIIIEEKALEQIEGGLK